MGSKNGMSIEELQNKSKDKLIDIILNQSERIDSLLHEVEKLKRRVGVLYEI